jgi:hypothetical protein
MFGFTDLEDRLLGAEGVSALRSALDAVRKVETDVRASVSAGLSHTDSAQARKILAAATAAQSILLTAAHPKGA